LFPFAALLPFPLSEDFSKIQSLHKMKKTSSPTCICPEKAVRTAQYLMTKCSPFSSERPAALRTLPPPLILKHHINTVGVTSFLGNILHSIQEQLKYNQTS
jgi:hypothetical protein